MRRSSGFVGAVSSVGGVRTTCRVGRRLVLARCRCSCRRSIARRWVGGARCSTATDVDRLWRRRADAALVDGFARATDRGRGRKAWHRVPESSSRKRGWRRSAGPAIRPAERAVLPLWGSRLVRSPAGGVTGPVEERLDRYAARVGWRLCWRSERMAGLPTLTLTQLEIFAGERMVTADGPVWSVTGGDAAPREGIAQQVANVIAMARGERGGAAA